MSEAAGATPPPVTPAPVTPAVGAAGRLADGELSPEEYLERLSLINER